MEQIQSKVLPLLKGNPLLIEWFQQCFPNKRPADCPLNEYETINFHKISEAPEECDVYEQIPQNEILPDPLDNPCHLRYINGRIYYGNRILLPAKLSFLVANSDDQVPAAAAVKSETTEEHLSDDNIPLAKRYRCVHNIKNFGDHKLKEQQKNTGDTEDGERTSTDDEPMPSTVADSLSPIHNSDDRNSSTEYSDISLNYCDEMMLKAHRLRLNPTAHSATDLSNASDLLNLLKPSTNGNSLSDRLSDSEGSPKKSSMKITRKSPIYKKSNSKSPNCKNSNDPIPIMPSTSTKSAAIQTANKLKILIDSSPNVVVLNNAKSSRKMNSKKSNRRQRKVSITTSTAMEVNSDTESDSAVPNDDEIVVQQQYKHEPELNISDCSEIVNDERSSPVKSNADVSWSRDEDKVVLEEIKLGGFLTEDDFVKRIQLRELLPDRSFCEILDRFKFLMDIIANL